MAFSVDPERVYCNLAAGSGGQSVSFSQYPEATVRENRFAPIISNIGNYDVAVVRAVLQGCRNLPLFIPTIVPGQPDPSLTAYAVTLTANMFLGTSTTWLAKNIPATTDTIRLDITTYDSSGQTVTPWTSIPIAAPTAGQTGANWATAITTAITGATSDQLLTSMTVAYGGDGKLIFQNAPATSGSFQICVYLLAADKDPVATTNPLTTPMPTLAQAFGFSYLQPGALPQSYILSSTAGGNNIHMPNVAFYLPPVAQPPVTVTVPLKWVSQNGLPLSDPRNVNTYDQQAYWCYDYDWFVGILNTALASAAQAMKQQVASNLNISLVYQTPATAFLASSASFSIIADANYTRTNTLIGGAPASVGAGQISGYVDIAFNGMLADLMMFPAAFNFYTGMATLNFSSAIPFSTISGYVQLTNNFSPTGSLWSPVDSLVFVTQAIPVKAETTPPIFQSGAITSGLGTSVSTTRDAAQMLTDVVPYQTDACQWRSQTQLYQANPYRWVSISQGNTGGLLTLDFSIGWRNNRSGTVMPIYLNPTSGMTVKLLFRRKDIQGLS